MPNMINYNLTNTDVCRSVEAIQIYQGTIDYTIKAAFYKKESAWQLIAAQITPRRVDDDIGENREYKNLALLTTNISIENPGTLIESIFSTGIKVFTNYPDIVQMANSRWQEIKIPSVKSPFEWPLVHYTCIGAEVHLLDDQVISFGLPYIASLHAAVRDHLPLCQISNGIPTGINIFFTDPRARILVENDKLSVFINGDSRAVGFIKKIDNSNVDIDEKCLYPIPLADVTHVEIWIVDRDDEIVDYLSTSTFPHRYAIERSLSLKQSVINNIGIGESNQCEFKVYISLGNKSEKSVEIDESVCALSNTMGGIIVFGVTDDLKVIGIESQLKKDYKTNLSDAVSLYMRSLEARISENLLSPNCISIESLELYGHTLVVIRVSVVQKYNCLRSNALPKIRQGPHNIDGTREIIEEFRRNANANGGLFGKFNI